MQLVGEIPNIYGFKSASSIWPLNATQPEQQLLLTRRPPNASIFEVSRDSRHGERGIPIPTPTLEDPDQSHHYPALAYNII